MPALRPKEHDAPHTNCLPGATWMTVSANTRGLTLLSIVGGICALTTSLCPTAIWLSGRGRFDASVTVAPRLRFVSSRFFF
jgi:hypothetical protein